MQKGANANVEGLTLDTQASLRISDKSGLIIHIDPFKIQKEDPADIILITHAHFDHLDLPSIKKVYKKGCTVLVPKGCEKISEVVGTSDVKKVEPGQELEIKGIKIKTVPAYNVVPDRLKFHPPENKWIGYLLQVNDQTVYHAGDTDHIEEMKQLNGLINIAFLPIGGTYTMDTKQAAQAIEAISPDIACPMHVIPAGDLAAQEKAQQEFKQLVESKGKTKVEILNGKGSFD